MSSETEFQLDLDSISSLFHQIGLNKTQLIKFFNENALWT